MNGVNDPPVAADDAYTTTYRSTLAVPAASGVLSNDLDVDSAALTATLISTPAHGSMTLYADGGFTYTPEVGFSGQDAFTYRTSDGASTSNVATVTLDVGIAPTYTLTVNTVGSGTITLNPTGGNYSADTIITLTATPNPGWRFTAWSGDLAGSTTPITLTMDSNKAVTATFSQEQYALVVDIVGNGTLTAVPSQATYLYGDIITLTATPNAGWQFTAWSADLAGSTTPITLTMDADKIITATFSQEQYMLAVTTVGSGTLAVDPSQATYLYGDVVTLTATPDPGWQFDGWSGALSSSTNPTTLTIDADKVVTATFSSTGLPTYTLTVVVNPTMGGTVTPNPPGWVYTANTVVTLTANPATGYQLSAWSGDLAGTANPATITMTRDMTVTASFDRTQFTVYLPIISKQ